MPIATMLMHGSVWGRAMDLMLWKRKKKDARRESSEGKERETKSKKEDKNCEKRQITTWHVFIGWRKNNVLRQFRTKFKLILIYELMSIRSKTFQNYLIRSLKLT